jgi:hypothetical protein
MEMLKHGPLLWMTHRHSATAACSRLRGVGHRLQAPTVQAPPLPQTGAGDRRAETCAVYEGTTMPSWCIQPTCRIRYPACLPAHLGRHQGSLKWHLPCDFMGQVMQGCGKGAAPYPYCLVTEDDESVYLPVKTCIFDRSKETYPVFVQGKGLSPHD